MDLSGHVSQSSSATSSETSDADAEDENLLQPGADKINSSAQSPLAASTAQLEKQSGVAKDGKQGPAKPKSSWGLGRLFWSPENEYASGPELISLAGSARPADDFSPEVASSENPRLASVPSTAFKESTADTARLLQLDRKILKKLLAELTDGGIFYSQTFDLTKSTQGRWSGLKRERTAAALESAVNLKDQEPGMSIPLCQRADGRFWWNSSISKPFLEAGVRKRAYYKYIYRN